MKRLTPILISVIVTLASVSVFAAELQVGTPECRAKILNMALERIQTKIKSTKNLEGMQKATEYAGGDVRNVLAMSSAQVTEMGKYLLDDLDQQMAHAAVQAKSTYGSFDFSVPLTVNDACTVIKMERAQTNPRYTLDGYANGE